MLEPYSNNNKPTPVLSVQSHPVTSAPTAYMLPTGTPAPITPTPTLTKSQTSQLQVIKATYSTTLGFQPNQLTVKAGTIVRLEVFAADNGSGCMGSIMLPDFDPNNIQGFTKGQTDVFEFTPTTPGRYPITCAMGILHGTVLVE